MRYVYLVCGGGKTKIGLATDPVQRLQALQACCPVPLRLLGAIESNAHGESLLHALFAERRTHNEWFEGEFTEEEKIFAFDILKAHSRLSERGEIDAHELVPVKRRSDQTKSQRKAEAEEATKGWTREQYRAFSSLRCSVPEMEEMLTNPATEKWMIPVLKWAITCDSRHHVDSQS
jgi:hypothetical protein